MAAQTDNNAHTCEYADVVITGGGASGLAAAIELGLRAPSLHVIILEKNEEPGRKIRATGSGRCNISNTAAVGYEEIQEFFGRIGLVTREYPNGLVYPYSESAADVADLLTSRAHRSGAGIITGAEVTRVLRLDDTEGIPGRFRIDFDRRSEDGRREQCCVYTEYVILATGGKAGPMYGTTGDGYAIARSLGHTVVTPVPVLTQVECHEWGPGAEPAAVIMAGTRCRGRVSLYRNTSPQDCDRNDTECAESGSLRGYGRIFEEDGEIQFTRSGLSGICVFNMTRHMRYDRRAGESMASFIIRTDLFPEGDIREYLRACRSGEFSGEPAAEILRTVLKSNIAEYVIKYAEQRYRSVCGRTVFDSRIPAAALSDGDIDLIAGSVHGLEFHPVSVRGWKDAQATSGGVSLDEIDPVTSGSLIEDGVYITGELADRDYPCGGFNLSNAWLTGIRAASSVADEYNK